MIVEHNVPLQQHNSFGIVARAQHLARISGEADVAALLADAQWRDAPKFVLGGGSNIVLTGDVKPLVLKVEIKGRRLVEQTPRAWVLEAGAGENWHDTVRWALDQGCPGLENMAMIPGTVGGAPVQNIGAYGVELQDRFDSLDAIDLETGRSFTLDAAQCAFGYRDSVFKHTANGANDFGLAGRAATTVARLTASPWARRRSAGRRVPAGTTPVSTAPRSAWARRRASDPLPAADQSPSTPATTATDTETGVPTASGAAIATP